MVKSISSNAPVQSNPVGIGIDISDRKSEVCVYRAGVVLERFKIASTPEGLRSGLEGRAPARVAIEVGTHSPWMSRLIEELGFEVYVANARRLKAISSNDRKSDRNDAELLAKLVLADPSLLFPIEHRSAAHDDAFAIVKGRDALVRVRARLVTTIRGLVKASGSRLKPCAVEAFPAVEPDVPEGLRSAVAPLFESLRGLNTQVDVYDVQLETLATMAFPETEYIRQIHGVGPVTSLALVLSIGDPERFDDARAVGAYFGLVPRRDQSGAVDKSLPISKTGNDFVRRLLVQSAQFMLGPLGRDCDIRRWGQAQIERRGKKGKKIVVIGAARKLAVLAFRLLRDRARWIPLHNFEKTVQDVPSATNESLPESRSSVTAGSPSSAEGSPSDPARQIAAPPARIPTCTEGNASLPESANRSAEPGKARSARKTTTTATGARAPAERVSVQRTCSAPKAEPSAPKKTAPSAGPASGGPAHGLRPAGPPDASPKKRAAV